ncbi:PDDEXK nuclease domain-containing protein [Limnohabitans sp.]|uniref:PDDEXK nuclease domain-containing protein n=1 Tax=Limnohabitans sp. TaxID=1907725 RepID=UPI00286EED61|nr:PDDEXK nuclease domain-containing protein [Limnohabitans sp.]
MMQHTALHTQAAAPVAAPAYASSLADLKGRIRSTRVQASLAVNRELVLLYWQIGREILQQRATQAWGSKVLEQLAKDLKAEFPEMRGWSLTNLKYMALFAKAWPEGLIGQQAADQLPWAHNCLLIDKVKDRPTREWYIRKTIEQGWSRSVLELQIETQAHTRFGAAQSNFSSTLPASDSDLAQGLLKDPYTFDFLALTEATNERSIERGLVGQMRQFLVELGVGFAFVGNQYRLEVEGDEFFIDLLFYHVRLHRYVVIELKNTEFKPEYVGKLNFYLAAVDDLVRDPAVDGPTIGLVLCKSKKGAVAQYALRDMGTPMGVSTYRTALPDAVTDLLPSVQVLTETMDSLSSSNPNPQQHKGSQP